MSRELLLLRHGKSDRYVEAADIDRPLKKRGKLGARRIGTWMREQGLVPDLILCSPAERAKATAYLVCEKLGIEQEDIHLDGRLYGRGVDSLRAVLSDSPGDSRRVLLIGHNPELEELLGELVGVDDLPITEKLVPTAALARIKMPDDWTQLEPGCAKLLSLTTAKSLLKSDKE
ncbi:MAG: SixA phosphatase family protein [Gammaproteobacteria bacterium]